MSATLLESPPVLGPDSNGRLMTPDEFDAVTEWDENYRYELVHGVLVVNSIPSEHQASPNDELGWLLRAYKWTHPSGAVLDETLPERYIRTTDSRRMADRVIWIGLGRTPDPKRDVPAIAVEFVSKGKRNWRRDYVEKKREYLEVGVKEYWIIDRFQRTMTVVLNAPGGPTETIVTESENYTTLLLPGFELPLARLFALADQWAASENE